MNVIRKIKDALFNKVNVDLSVKEFEYLFRICSKYILDINYKNNQECKNKLCAYNNNKNNKCPFYDITKKLYKNCICKQEFDIVKKGFDSLFDKRFEKYE